MMESLTVAKKALVFSQKETKRARAKTQEARTLAVRRVVLLKPRGTDWLISKMLAIPEMVLKRLVAHRTASQDYIKRLQHRYAFMGCITDAWNELISEERQPESRTESRTATPHQK